MPSSFVAIGEKKKIATFSAVCLDPTYFAPAFSLCYFSSSWFIFSLFFLLVMCSFISFLFCFCLFLYVWDVSFQLVFCTAHSASSILQVPFLSHLALLLFFTFTDALSFRSCFKMLKPGQWLSFLRSCRWQASSGNRAKGRTALQRRFHTIQQHLEHSESD